MPYIGKFVRCADAVQEIARVHFDGDTEKADANLRLALRDGDVSALSEEPGVGPLSVKDFPKFLVSPHHWNADRSLMNDTSWRRDCVLRRADLIKIFPGLWETVGNAEPSKGDAHRRGRRPISESKQDDVWRLFDQLKSSLTFERGEFSKISQHIADDVGYRKNTVEKMIRDAYQMAKNDGSP